MSTFTAIAHLDRGTAERVGDELVQASHRGAPVDAPEHDRVRISAIRLRRTSDG
jgi:hypothetical protein